MRHRNDTMRAPLILMLLCLRASLTVAAEPAAIDGQTYDLAVIGGTPGGIACAVRAAREGLRVLLVNHTQHLGGFTTSGAGGWEAPSDAVRSPIYGEMLTGAADHYRATYGNGSPQHILSMPSATSRAHIDRAKVEPRVAEMLFDRMVGAETNITVLLGHIVDAAARDGSILRSVTLKPMRGETRVTVTAKVFADAMYEGDLMAAANVSTRIGREARSEYNEPHAGVLYTLDRHKQKGQRGFPLDADQGRINIRYNSHATADIVEGPQSGEADTSVMAYNWRLVLTRVPSNRVMVAKPANYDPALARKAANGGFVPNLPNDKVAWNGGRLIGPQNAYPAAGWPERERIAKHALDAMLMALWYMQNDPAAPADQRKRFEGYGLAADEFPDNGSIPYEIYVREARRLVGRAIFTEHDNLIAEGTARTPVHPDSIAFTDWPVDSVACLPRKTGKSNMDGILFLAEVCRPAQIPYRCLLPKEADNLLAPVALSASHVGWGSIRLEPVWMQTGEAAGFAAALAVKRGVTPAALDADLLIRTLVKNRVMVTFFNDVDVTSSKPWVPAVEYFGTQGFFPGYDARPGSPLTEPLAQAWADAFNRLRNGQRDPQATACAVTAAEAHSERAPVPMNRFLALIKHTDSGKSAAPLTRADACRLMFKILETK